jgi:hypothetical protein
LLGAVTYSGALTVQTLGGRYGMEIALWQPSLFIALIAMIYVVCGGLKASVWADLLQGSALILGGAVILFFAFSQLASVDEAATVADVSTGEVVIMQLDAQQGALARFMELNANRLNMFLPADDHVLPWTALLLGLWIPNFYYWGLNQYITQRTLGSSSLSQGQKGIVFAAFLKLLIPFVVVIPGIIAFNLFHHEMQLESRGDADAPRFGKPDAVSDEHFDDLSKTIGITAHRLLVVSSPAVFKSEPFCICLALVFSDRVRDDGLWQTNDTINFDATRCNRGNLRNVLHQALKLLSMTMNGVQLSGVGLASG